LLIMGMFADRETPFEGLFAERELFAALTVTKKL